MGGGAAVAFSWATKLSAAVVVLSAVVADQDVIWTGAAELSAARRANLLMHAQKKN